MWTNEGPAIYLDSTRTKTVAADDPAAAFLLVASGGQIPLAEAQQYGLVADAKAKAHEANKAKAPTSNKGA